MIEYLLINICLDFTFLGKKDVLHLMDLKKNPFPTKPPKYVRMQLYHYHFTGSTNDIVPKNELDWWSREFKSEYLPAISLEQEADIKKILTQMGVHHTPSSKKSKQSGNISAIKGFLDYIRDTALLVEPHILVWSVSLPVFPIMFSM